MNSRWKVLEKSLGRSRGLDIKAQNLKNSRILIVEAKGSKANPRARNRKRPKFDSGQIKDHFGKALVKVLEQRHMNPKATVAIAQPDDPYIRQCLQYATPETRGIGIRLFWVKSSKTVRTR